MTILILCTILHKWIYGFTLHFEILSKVLGDMRSWGLHNRYNSNLDYANFQGKNIF